MKMYILVKDSVPLGYAMVAAAHASLAGYLKYKESSEVQEWLSGPFRKVVCKVTADQFEISKLVADNVIVRESQLDNDEVAIAFKPRNEWPRGFQFFKLYKG